MRYVAVKMQEEEEEGGGGAEAEEDPERALLFGHCRRIPIVDRCVESGDRW